LQRMTTEKKIIAINEQLLKELGLYPSNKSNDKRK
jgi:hypothetical protein